VCIVGCSSALWAESGCVGGSGSVCRVFCSNFLFSGILASCFLSVLALLQSCTPAKDGAGTRQGDELFVCCVDGAVFCVDQSSVQRSW
jgi:hypothetical protein